ncbi:DUF302 domain-containing protein [Euzebya sp.]|uniref:DUF302 domain-containing protein n=1 Tax=Euzebya sp. TaxID=1971409 RepID=UPI00351991DA
MSTYAMTVSLTDDPATAESRVRDALAAEGFGILSTIDVRAALLEKLGEDVGHYTILGACNPPLAHQALAADRDIGALLPCNVVVRAAEGGGSEVAAADPRAMVELAGDALAPVAADARDRLERALAALG